MGDVRKLREAVGEIARQKKTNEMSRDELDFADFEGGYDACIDKARAILRALEGGGADG